MGKVRLGKLRGSSCFDLISVTYLVVALLFSSRPPIAFINSEEDLAVFIKDFKERDDYTQALGSILIF